MRRPKRFAVGTQKHDDPFTATEGEVRRALVKLAPLRSVLRVSPAPRNGFAEVPRGDPMAPCKARSHVSVLPLFPEVEAFIGASADDIDTLIEQYDQMLALADGVESFDCDAAVTEHLIALLEAEEQDRLIEGTRRLIAEGNPGDPFIIQLKSDAGALLNTVVELEDDTRRQAKRTLKEKRQGNAIMAMLHRKSRMLDLMLALKNGKELTQDEQAELYAAIEEFNIRRR